MLLFLDLETTGFDNTSDCILEIAAARWDGEKITQTYQTLVHLPEGKEISPFVQRLTGITPEMCMEEGISMEQAKKELEEFLLPDDIITGHNISFDTGFLKANNVSVPQSEIDTFILSLLILGRKEESHSLEILSEKYGFVHENAHRAMSDVEANIELYAMMETVWAHNYDQTLHDFVIKNTEYTSFPEQYFFTNTAENTSSITKRSLPDSSFIPFIQQWNTPDETYNTVTTTLKESNAPVFWETSQPDRNILPLCTWAMDTQTPVAFVYPDDKKQKYQEFFTSAISHLSQDTPATFMNNAKSTIDEDKWQTFLAKDTYNREESVVLVKTFRAKMLDQEHMLKFMNEEWATARSLFIDGTELPIPHNDIILFVPFSSVHSLPSEMVTVILEGENIEEMITEKNTTKVFINRWLQDNIVNTDNGNTPEDTLRTEEMKSVFEDMAKALRADKGENQYSIQIPFSQAKYISGFPDIWTRGKAIMETDTMGKMKELLPFFSAEVDENIFLQVEIFSDNNLAFSAIPVQIDSFANALLCENTLVMGSAFPRYNDAIIFSFLLPEETIDIVSPLSTIKSFSVPEVRRTITAKETIPFIQAFIDNGQNIVFSVNSKKVGEEIADNIREIATQAGYSIFAQGAGSIGKMRVQIPMAEKKIIIATPKYLDILRVEDYDCTAMMIMKPMFDPPKHPFLSKRRELFRSDFEEFSIPRSKARFTKELRRLAGNCDVFLGDGRAGDMKSWARTFWVDC